MKSFNLVTLLTYILLSNVAMAQQDVLKKNDSEGNLNKADFNFLEPSAEKDIFFPKYINHGIIYNYRFKTTEVEEKTKVADPDEILVPVISPITIPNLVVKTILYKDAKNWAVWVNGKKITQFNQYENKNFSIFSISKNFVQFVMFYPDLKFFEKSLSAKLSPYQKKPEDVLNMPIEASSLDWEYSNESETILVNKEEGIVLVTLEPSQSFSSNDMTIKEAFYKLSDPITLQPDIAPPPTAKP